MRPEGNGGMENTQKSLLILEIDDSRAWQILNALALAGIERVLIKQIGIEQLQKKEYKNILYITPLS